MNSSDLGIVKILGANNVNTADVVNLKNLPTRLCVGSVCFHSSNSTLCIGSSCLNSTELATIESITSQVISTSLCIGSSCLSSTDISNVRSLPAQINSTNVSIGSNCIVTSDLTNLKALPTRINDTRVCIGSNCLDSGDLSNTKSIDIHFRVNRVNSFSANETTNLFRTQVALYEKFTVSAGWDTTNGQYIARVAGYYQFSIYVRCVDGVSDCGIKPYRLSGASYAWVINQSDQSIWVGNDGSAAQRRMASYTTSVYMGVNDRFGVFGRNPDRAFNEAQLYGRYLSS